METAISCTKYSQVVGAGYACLCASLCCASPLILRTHAASTSWSIQTTDHTHFRIS